MPPEEITSRTSRDSTNRKIFCVGRNKTGTTSMGCALKNLGYKLGSQNAGELLLEDWGRGDFRKIIELCETADAFQDVPFSLDGTYKVLDAHFPTAKFILTVRDTPEQWYESLTRFHTNIINKGRLPTAEDLSEFDYCYKGYVWREEQLAYGVNEQSLYDQATYITRYLDHNRNVIQHFKHRPGSLLVLNASEKYAMKKICDFLDRPWTGQQMPHLNQSRPAVSSENAPSVAKISSTFFK